MTKNAVKHSLAEAGDDGKALLFAKAPEIGHASPSQGKKIKGKARWLSQRPSGLPDK